MEIREFATQVLFATSLKEKLRPPDRLTDTHPGPALPTPRSPGRPLQLQFKPAGGGQKSEFPGLRQLEQTAVRGKLLHFFANHELLATELMALVLLKFPDAPAAFRQGVAQTLQDEQEHTRLYIERMQACGTEFGQLPVSGYFWRCVSPMESPMDYVASLCLTFEQANLDFAGHFARGFAAVGDEATAQLLTKIYRDEIGHVAYGLKWFRRWKNPTQSDWEAFCRTLKFPLSPQRAKGFTLNLAGRRAAGLDPQFIAELEVYAQSKGRTPGVFVFNPFTEGHLAQGKAFNPNRFQAQLARDLENLPQFLCRQDDLVLVEQKPSVTFLSRIKQAGFALPEFVEFRSLETLRHRKLGRLRPWAWGPDSATLLQSSRAHSPGEAPIPALEFNESLAPLYSKSWSAAFLGQVLTRAKEEHRRRDGSNPLAGAQGEPAYLCTEQEVGTTAHTLAEAMAAIAAIRRRGHHAVVVKEAFGLAGSNAVRLLEPDILETHQRWMAKALQRPGQLVIEPWLERELDFSIQLEMSKSGLKLCGYTGLINDARGQFQANWAESHHHQRIPARVVALFPEWPGIATRLLEFYHRVFAQLEVELGRVDFQGPLGIDALVYRHVSGTCQLKPIVEINPRYTMGRLLVELMHQTRQGSCGMFRLINQTQLQAEGFTDFSAYAQALQERRPLQLEGEPVPKIAAGALCLNDPARAQVGLAVFQVGRTLEATLNG